MRRVLAHSRTVCVGNQLWAIGWQLLLPLFCKWSGGIVLTGSIVLAMILNWNGLIELSWLKNWSDQPHRAVQSKGRRRRPVTSDDWISHSYWFSTETKRNWRYLGVTREKRKGDSSSPTIEYERDTKQLAPPSPILVMQRNLLTSSERFYFDVRKTHPWLINDGRRMHSRST